MKAIPGLATRPLCLGLLLLCSCVAPHSISAALPEDVPMNKDAGRGGLLIVTVKLKDGEKLPMAVDTGASGTLVDRSLEPKLGKLIGKGVSQSWGVKQEDNFHESPGFYLGKTLLAMTGPAVMVHDFSRISANAGFPIKGILGMDILEHYCIQLDFAAGKMRFLDDTRADAKTWGAAFPLVALNSADGRPAVAGNLLGAKGLHSLIDTGCDYDGWLMPKYFAQWTNAALALAAGEVHSPKGTWNGQTYLDLDLHQADVESDGIGLRFLARHLVTLDFPKRTMYLKLASLDPLVDKRTESTGKAVAKSAVAFLEKLKNQGRLPGWSKHDKQATESVHFNYDGPNAITCDHLQKEGDSSYYNYTLIRAAESSPWKLQKAWRTDADGYMLGDYRVP